MNTANLQLEGVYAILAALFGAVQDKGLLSAQELDHLLAGVEAAAEHSRPPELREANVEAIRFPARLLRCALRAGAEGRVYSFSQLASEVGQRKWDR
jgi:hypothetical protein